MSKIVGVSFSRCGKIYRFDTGELELFPGDWVVVETARGMELGQIMLDKLDTSEGGSIKTILRKATVEDFEKHEENRYKSAEAFRIGLEKIKKHGLPMKLIETQYTLDQSKIVFYFSADGRVDFRTLVRDLASVFHKRIELHQIGVRDVAKMLGGLGPCGRTCCCATFLTNFDPVSIKMAKEQGLSLNPVKISGACGRLMCCLKYEHDQYVEELKKMPPLEAKIDTPEGKGIVVDLNVPHHKVIVMMPSDARVSFPAEAIVRSPEGGYQIRKDYDYESVNNKKKKKWMK